MKTTGAVLGALLSVVFCLYTLSGCKRAAAPVTPNQAFGSYDTEPDWSDSTKEVKLGYQESQGKRIFYQYCVWCHADATPAGPSNRSNLNTVPPLATAGTTFNTLRDGDLPTVLH